MPGDFDLVKERIDLVQLVGERVPLRKAGRIYKGLCPFHAEKTPSFIVDPDRRTYHCFSCGQHGDAFTWLEKQDGLQPVEALQVLAERAGVQLTRRAPEEREHEKRLLAANETAHFYFRQALRGTPAGKAAAEYLAKRGIEAATVEKFGLGYAPEIRDGLLQYLRKKGYSDEEAIASGLVIAGERGLFDRFRDRLMVPIRDGRGRIVAFGGRAMRTGQEPKYMNSPATELFDKSTTLYAIDVAKPSMRRKGEAVIVEGYFDAIASHQAGLDNVVASMGTALTEGQYRILDDLKIERAVVTFDGDAAGTASAEKRGREINAIVQRYRRRAGRRGTVATSQGTTVHVAVLPEGDPDELARRDPDALRKILAAAEPLQAFVIRRAEERADLATPEGRRRFVADVLPVLASEPDPIIREGYMGTVAGTTGLPHELIRQQVDSYVPPPTPAPRSVTQTGAFPSLGGPRPGTAAGPAAPTGAVPSGNGKQTTSLERYVMAQLVQYPEEAARLDLDPDELVDPDHRAILELLRSGERPGPRYPAHLAAVVAALGALTPTPVDEDNAARAIEMAVPRLREENLRRRIGEKRQARARGGGDAGALDEEIDQLTDELKRLMRMRERDTVLHEAAGTEEQ
jgi:DNA primase